MKRQLLEAQSQAEAEDDEAELARAAAAVARLTAPAAASEGAAKDAFWSAQRVRNRLFGRNKPVSRGNTLVSNVHAVWMFLLGGEGRGGGGGCAGCLLVCPALTQLVGHNKLVRRGSTLVSDVPVV